MVTDKIIQLIPQRHPFVMIDVLLCASKNITATSFTVTSDNILCEGNFFTEAGLMENIAQTIAAGKGYLEQQENKKTSGGYIAGIKNFEVFFLPQTNDVLKTETNIINSVFNMITVAGKIFVNDLLCAQCEMKVFANTND